MDDGATELPTGVVRLSRGDSSTSLAASLRTLAVAAHDPGGRTLWVDAANRASTYTLFDHARANGAGGERALSGLRVARAFTAHQHRELVRRLPREADADTGLVVAPAVDALYAAGDVPDDEGRELLAGSLSILAELAGAVDCPVLTTARTDAFAGLVAERADATVECTATRFGHRFDGPGVGTEVYRCGAGWQTTIPYWVDLLGAAAAPQPAPGALPALAEG
jgi:hypothetical protein